MAGQALLVLGVAALFYAAVFWLRLPLMSTLARLRPAEPKPGKPRMDWGGR
jgi:hypothetical protein